MFARLGRALRIPGEEVARFVLLTIYVTASCFCSFLCCRYSFSVALLNSLSSSSAIYRYPLLGRDKQLRGGFSGGEEQGVKSLAPGPAPPNAVSNDWLHHAMIVLVTIGLSRV